MRLEKFQRNVLCFLVFLVFLNPVFSQCPPTGCTTTISSNTSSVTPGAGTTCILAGVTVTTLNTINSGSTVINCGTIGSATIGQGTLVNRGSVTSNFSMSSNGVIDNYGSMSTSSTTSGFARGIINNYSTGTITRNGSLTIGNSSTATVNNQGVISLSGSNRTLTLSNSSNFTNSGTINIGTSGSGSVSIGNGSELTTTGTLNVGTSSGGTFTVSSGGTCTFDGSINILSNISVSGDLIVNTSFSSTGTIAVNSGGELRAGDDDDCNRICASGNISCHASGTLGGGSFALVVCKALSSGSVTSPAVVSNVSGEPSNSPTGLSLTVVGNNVNGSFTAAAAGGSATTGYIVLRRLGSAVADVPVDDRFYAVGDVIGSSTVVAINNTATVSFTDPVQSCQTHHYAVFSIRGAGYCYNYRTSSPLTGSRSITTPSITGTTPNSRCGTGTVSLGAAASSGTINWYTVSSGGTSIGTGTSFVTPSISSTTSYFVDANVGGCFSASRTEVIATVSSAPTITGSTNGSRCGTGTVNLGATASVGTINWYENSSGGVSLGTGTSFVTPSISSTTLYYVDATNAGCTTPTRTAVTATVTANPTVTGTTPGSRCDAGTVNLSATASVGSLVWYDVISGGTDIGNGSPFTTPSISSTTTYYVEVKNGSCLSSPRTAVVATVNTTPSVTGTTAGSRCGTGSVNLSATASAGTLRWFDVISGGTQLGTGTSFATPSISSTTTYYVEADHNGCTSPRQAVIATVNTIPTITSTTPNAVCNSGSMTLGATASGGVINWYANASGGPSLGTGSSFVTPVLGTTTTYYVDATLGSCTTTSRTSVNANVTPNPTVSSTAPGSTCGDGTVSLGATASAGSINWYDLASGGTLLGSGNSFVTPIISSNTTYFAEAVHNGCSSVSRSSVLATYLTPPTITSTTPAERCNTGTVTLNATASAGTIGWYANASGGVALGTGTSFNTPSISSNTTYYVESVNAGCASLARTPVLATVWALPTTANAGANINQCNDGNFTLAGNTPLVGTGNWVITFGTATIADPSSPTSGVSGVAVGAAITLRWTISNGTCPVSQDNVTIRNFAPATVSNAGSDMGNCNSGSFSMAANVPSVGSGLWSVTSGTATIGNVTLANSGITGVPVGTAAVLTWTITNGACSSASSITLNNYQTPTTSNAGTNISQCNSSSFTLAANNPAVGIGTWSVISGPATILNTADRNSGATLPVGQTATLQWSIANGTCPPSTSNVILTNNTPATVSNAGTNQSNCNSGSFTLNANNPVVGSGLWSVVSGTATITTPTSRTSTVTGVPLGTSAVLSWTITNGACTSQSNVTLTNAANPTTSNAGAAIFNCENTVFTMAANTPVVGTGAWSVVSGSVNIETPTSPTTQVTLTSGSSATLRWTISNAPCPSSSSTVTITNVIINASSVITHVTCPGGFDGAVNLTVSGGLAPYGYLWNGLVTTEDLSGVPAEMYTCLITDSRGCTKQHTAVVTDPPDITISETQTNASCGWCPDGSITISAGGGTPGYTYLWDNGSTSTTRSGIPPGFYPVTVRDSRNCSRVFDMEIRGPVHAQIITTSACTPNDGFANVVGSGGTPPYTFLWHNGSTATSVNGLSSGNIWCRITDAFGNQYTQTSKVTNADYTNISVNPTNQTICPGTAVNITASNVQNPVWSPGTGLSSTTIANPVATPVVTTTYTLQETRPTPTLVTNGDFSGGNTGFFSDYGYVSPTQNALSGNRGLWPEGYYAVGTNPFTYHPHWSGADHTTGSGDLMIINGAPVDGAIVWTQTIGVINQNTNYSFSVWIASVHNSNTARLRFSINGTLIGPTIQGPTTVGQWVQFSTTWNSGSAVTAEIAIVNINTIRGGNDFGLDDISFTTTCTNPNVAQVVINVNQPPAVSVQPVSTNGCIGQGTSFSVSATGAGLTYRWQISTNGGGTWNNLNNGGSNSGVTTTQLNISGIIGGMNNYRYRVVITGTCSPTATSNAAILTTVATPSVSATSPGATCGPGTVNLGATPSAGTINWYTNPSGGTSIASGNSYTTPSISSNTTYYVDATNNGCTTVPRTAVTATVNTIPTLSSTADGSRCSSGTVTLTASPSAGTVRWFAAASGGSSLFTGLSYTTPSISTTTTYFAEAFHNNCPSVSRTPVQAIINSPPVVSVPPSNANICIVGNGSFSVTATASNPTYQWFLSTNGGGAYNPVVNGGVYSGATTNTLNITGATQSMDGYLYRVTVSSPGCSSVNSSSASISVRHPGLGLSGYSPSTGDYFWTGFTSISWDVTTNWLRWSGSTWEMPSVLPTTNNNAYIRTGGVGNSCVHGDNQPTIYTTSYCDDIFIESGAVLTTESNQTLNVRGDWENQGTFICNVGTVEFMGTANQIVKTHGIGVGKRFYNVGIRTPNNRRLIVPEGHEMKVLNDVTVQP